MTGRLEGYDGAQVAKWDEFCDKYQTVIYAVNNVLERKS